MPREGHDFAILSSYALRPGFQSTCPARGTTTTYGAFIKAALFQSTCPARGTTVEGKRLVIDEADFNPRAPRGARLYAASGAGAYAVISIHVPREGHDLQNLGAQKCAKRFQSTCPARGTTTNYYKEIAWRDISIHVPREGHD